MCIRDRVISATPQDKLPRLIKQAISSGNTGKLTSVVKIIIEWSSFVPAAVTEILFLQIDVSLNDIQTLHLLEEKLHFKEEYIITSMFHKEMEVWSWSVSYTHLDVYKRQV